MKNRNLSKFVLRAATTLAVLTLSATLFVFSSPPAFAGKLTDYSAMGDFASLQAYSFAAITNTSTAASTITIEFIDPDGNAEARESSTVEPGATWVLSSASGLSKEVKGTFGFGTFAFVPPPPSPYGYDPFSVIAFALWKKKNEKKYSAFPIKVVDETGTNASLSIIKSDKKITTAFVDELNKKHVADKDVRKVGENILKTDPRISQLIKDRAKLHKKIAKQGKAPDTTGKAAGGGKLPDYHTITITVSREENREMGKEFGKIALPGGEGEVALPGGGTKDITVGGTGTKDIAIGGGKKGVTTGGKKTGEVTTASGKLPDYHTITITVSRDEDREMGKEFGKIALPGGEGEVALPGGSQDITIGGGKEPRDITIGGDIAVRGETTTRGKDGLKDVKDLLKDLSGGETTTKGKDGLKDVKDLIKDLSGGKKLTDKAFPCPQPPADHPINVGSKMKVGTGIGKLAGGIAKGLVGGFLGGGGRGGGDDFMDSDEGPDTSRDPIKKKDKTKFTDPDTGTKIRVGAKATKDGLLFSTHIDKAPGKGTFQTVFLENNNGLRMLPVRYYVYKIWAKITLTVSWTRSTYVDGQLVKRESGGWSESWTKDLGTFVHRELGEMPVEGQPIWRRMGYGRATQGVRGLGTEFPITVDQLKESGPVSFVVHITRPKQNPVTTVPFIIQASVNADGDIELTQIEQTPATARCQ